MDYAERTDSLFQVNHNDFYIPRSINEECLSQLILCGEKPLQRAVSSFLEHYHQERNHQVKGNLLLVHATVPESDSRPRMVQKLDLAETRDMVRLVSKDALSTLRDDFLVM